MKDNRQKGFSLIELLISMVVLSIGFLATVVMMSGAMGGNDNGRRLTEASTIAADHIEYLMSIAYGHVDLGAGGGNIRNPAQPAGQPTDTLNPVLRPADYSTSVMKHNRQYTVYWNVVNNAGVANTKTVNVIVLDSDEINEALNQEQRARFVLVEGVIADVID